jgi:hypothetical protein
MTIRRRGLAELIRQSRAILAELDLSAQTGHPLAAVIQRVS